MGMVISCKIGDYVTVGDDTVITVLARPKRSPDSYIRLHIDSPRENRILRKPNVEELFKMYGFTETKRSKSGMRQWVYMKCETPTFSTLEVLQSIAEGREE